MHVCVGAYRGRRSCAVAGALHYYVMYLTGTRGEAAESLPSKAVCRNKTGSEKGNEAFAKHSYGNHVTDTT